MQTITNRFIHAVAKQSATANAPFIHNSYCKKAISCGKHCKEKVSNAAYCVYHKLLTDIVGSKVLTHHLQMPSVVHVPQVEKHCVEQDYCLPLQVPLYTILYIGSMYTLNESICLTVHLVFHLISPVVLK